MQAEDMAMEVDSDDSSGIDEETEQAIKDYLYNTPEVDKIRASASRPTYIYTPEQQEDIALIKEAIAVITEGEAKYKEIEDTLYRSIKEVRNKIMANEQAILKESNTNEGGFSYLRSGKPYFKDKYNFPAPDNEDTIMMRRAQMYDFSQVSSVPGWSIKDKTQLVTALQEMSRDIRRRELMSEITRLRRDDKISNVLKIARLEREITQLHKKTLLEIALPLDKEYDWEALANSLNRRHTAQEYQALWKLFFHPSINKKNWSKNEHQELQKISTAFNMQDWDRIAKKLNTGRTGYQCFVYYRTNMVDISTNRRWTAEEIEYLQRVIDYFREDTYIPWGKVASAMDNRTKIQVYNKYTRMIERRKGRFLEEEDIVILNCHDKYGNNFKKIAEYLPGRSAVQLRTRFNLLTKYRLSTTWTVEDDKKLIQIMANLDTNSSFSNATAYFPGKDRMHIRSRYKTLMKWMKAHPATDLEMAPRRGARRLAHAHALISLNEALANLNSRMESEVKTKKNKRITQFSREEDIEDAIMAALINEIIKEESYRKPDRSEIGDVTGLLSPRCAPSQNISNLRKVLVMLNACLDKNKFVNSRYGRQFPGLADSSHEVSHLKVKSYSKIQRVKTMIMDESPDVWGNIQLGSISYVLPPNYATITGCRVLMNQIGSRPELSEDEEVNLSMMARRNVFLKEALGILKEKFTTLFLWPILLSNEGPRPMGLDEVYIPRPTFKQKYLPQPPAVTIPPTKKTHIRFEAQQAKKLDEAENTNTIDYNYQDAPEIGLKENEVMTFEPL